MKLYLLRDGHPRRTLELPQRRTAGDVPVPDEKCPHCAEPLKVGGANKRIAEDDRAYESDAGCISCGRYVGTLRLETGTLFGVREDEAVLRGRVRVY